MNQEEKDLKRDLIRTRKTMAIAKVSKLKRIFHEVGIANFIVTGSQALIIQGFMTHRDGEDMDFRICLPNVESIGDDYSKRILQTLKSWETLFPEEKAKTKGVYGNSANNDKLFTIVVDGMKVNIFVLTEEEYVKIPFNNINGIMVESISSVLIDKMELKRAKDYKDLTDCYVSWVND
jgi:hypothetical protein